MKSKKNFFIIAFFLAAAFLPLGCPTGGDEDEGSSDNGSSVSVTVSPSSVTLAKGTTQQFSATVTNSYSSGVTWTLEGNSSPETAISQEGLLSVAGNESAGILTVKATWSSYGDTASGTATVTIAAEREIPNLKIAGPGKTGILLSWSAVDNAANYKVYRSTNGKDFSYLGDASAASYNDTAVAAGSSYYYAVSAVVNGRETGRSAVAFGFAEEYFALPVFADRRLVPLVANQKHYYRFPVTSGESYTITWENGSSQNADWSIACTAWQNDGTAIFTNERNGYTSPKVFTAAATGYVTVEVKNTNGSNRYNYMAYCLRKNSETDTGIAALPPAPVTGIKVTAPSATSITLGWNSVSDAVSYNIYRSPTQSAVPGLSGSSNSPAFTDTAVAPNAVYYYTVAPVNADGKEGVQVQGAFACAAVHYSLPTYSSSYKMNLPANAKHYYRLAVSAGQTYIITWENGSSQNADWSIACTAWQNDGTAIFTNERNGYTSPRSFTATATGYVTVEVKNTNSSTGYDYQIYY